MKNIGNSMYGTKYSIEGTIPFDTIDLSDLKYGDVIIDNDGRGMSLYVNECSTCYKKFLGTTLIFSLEECTHCSSYSRYKRLRECPDI